MRISVTSIVVLVVVCFWHTISFTSVLHDCLDQFIVSQACLIGLQTKIDESPDYKCHIVMSLEFLSLPGLSSSGYITSLH